MSQPAAEQPAFASASSPAPNPPDRPGPPEAAAPGLAPVDRRIFLVAAGPLVLLLALSARYGIYRDELYFLDCARHLQLAYVDQPIFTPLLARLSLSLFGVSAVGLRLWPALAAFGTVVTAGLLAREFGGGRTAQLLAALGVATAPALLGADHVLDTTGFDLLAWSVLALIVARLGRTGNTRLWVPAGLVLGLGLANKHSIGFFALALVIGLLLSGGRALLASRYLAVGALIAVAFTIPDLWWQAQHGWATIEMTRVLAQENGGLGSVAGFVVTQFFYIAPILIGAWILGLRFLWRSGRPAWRALAWSYGLLFVFFALTAGGKPYYVVAMYFYLLAAGSVALERRWATSRGRFRIVLAAALPACLLLTLPIALPVLPASRAGGTATINPVAVETVGWPQLVSTVSRVWHQLPARQRARAVIFTGNYGEAGAVTELGRADGLPAAVSGQNNEWYWGPGDASASTVVAIVQPGFPELVTQLRRDFSRVRSVATISNPEHLSNQEQGARVYLCTGPVRPWGQLWPSFRFDS
jgi:4-amino-4-deoxy-L-arabinose transferase-like glycosyltransferase